MAGNGDYFPGGKPTRDVLLAARGFAADGSRSGGIKLGGPVTIPAGAALLRLYNKQNDFGEWWMTPYELSLIFDYFAVDPVLLAAGRGNGRSQLHGLFALLAEWYNGDPGQLGRFHVATACTPLVAMYGEGDCASTAGYGRTLKPAQLTVGTSQRAARQIFLPHAWEYKADFALVPMSNTATDTGLASVLTTIRWSRLPFEN